MQGQLQGRMQGFIQQGLKYGAFKEQIIQDLVDECHVDMQTAALAFEQYQKENNRLFIESALC